MGFLSKLWKKLKPVRKIGKDLAQDYAERKVAKEIERRVGGDRRKEPRD